MTRHRHNVVLRKHEAHNVIVADNMVDEGVVIDVIPTGWRPSFPAIPFWMTNGRAGINHRRNCNGVGIGCWRP